MTPKYGDWRKHSFYIPYVSVDDIPQKEFKRLHKQYWMLIAECRLNWKPYIYSSITGKELYVTNDCFACAYKNRFKKHTHYTYCEEVCPVTWGLIRGENIGCGEPGSPYEEWGRDDDVYKSILLAAQIANLPWED